MRACYFMLFVAVVQSQSIEFNTLYSLGAGVVNRKGIEYTIKELSDKLPSALKKLKIQPFKIHVAYPIGNTTFSNINISAMSTPNITYRFDKSSNSIEFMFIVQELTVSWKTNSVLLGKRSRTTFKNIKIQFGVVGKASETHPVPTGCTLAARITSTSRTINFYAEKVRKMLKNKLCSALGIILATKRCRKRVIPTCPLQKRPVSYLQYNFTRSAALVVTSDAIVFPLAGSVSLQNWTPGFLRGGWDLQQSDMLNNRALSLFVSERTIDNVLTALQKFQILKLKKRMYARQFPILLCFNCWIQIEAQMFDDDPWRDISITKKEATVLMTGWLKVTLDMFGSRMVLFTGATKLKLKLIPTIRHQTFYLNTELLQVRTVIYDTGIPRFARMMRPHAVKRIERIFELKMKRLIDAKLKFKYNRGCGMPIIAPILCGIFNIENPQIRFAHTAIVVDGDISFSVEENLRSYYGQ